MDMLETRFFHAKPEQNDLIQTVLNDPSFSE